MNNSSTKKQVCVLMGGLSAEREVSLASGRRVLQTLEQLNNEYSPYSGKVNSPDEFLPTFEEADIVFNCLHGGIGENGTIQALLELLNIPYPGTSPMGCRIAIDKLYSKKVFSEAGLNVPAYRHIKKPPTKKQLGELQEKLGLPLVIKPRYQGSSIGITISSDLSEIEEKLTTTLQEFTEVVVEEYIPGMEVTAGLVETENTILSLPLIELEVKSEPFYNYTAKYSPGETEFIIPARLPDPTEQKVVQTSKQAYKALGCSGYGRVDLKVTEQEKPVLLEVNTLPGMTDTSDLPQAAESADINYGELIQLMLNSAITDL